MSAIDGVAIREKVAVIGARAAANFCRNRICLNRGFARSRRRKGGARSPPGVGVCSRLPAVLAAQFAHGGRIGY